jgi:DNA-binding transcriptional MerR regulator
LNRTQRHTLRKIEKEIFMDRLTQNEVLLTAFECARRIGLSVRALRLYEQHGLISPRRTSKQWRLYGRSEIARLNEILALKSLGLSLREISKLLCGQVTDPGQTLAFQREALIEAKGRAERGLQMIDTVQAKMRAGDIASIDDFIMLAKETMMTNALKETIAWRRYEQMRPRTEIPIDKALYAVYAGAYETEDGTISVVSEHEGKLFYRIVGQCDIEIFPESDTEFFMKILPVQIKFDRDAGGNACGLRHHQNGFQDYAQRADAEEVKKLEHEVQQRIQDQKALPQGEAILQRVIEQHQRGEPDLEGMSPALAALVEEQKDFIQDELGEAGPLKAVSFKGVSRDGLDIYDVEFENAKIEWGFAVTHRGKISHLYLRQVP